MKQQPLNGDHGVVDGFIPRFAKFIANLTAITVDTEANIVEESVSLAIYGYGRQILNIFLN